jgi:beta-glucosidase
VKLQAGETKEVTVNIDSAYLSVFDEAADEWKMVPGAYSVMVGGSSQELPLVQKVTLK